MALIIMLQKYTNPWKRCLVLFCCDVLSADLPHASQHPQYPTVMSMTPYAIDFSLLLPFLCNVFCNLSLLFLLNLCSQSGFGCSGGCSSMGALDSHVWPCAPDSPARSLHPHLRPHPALYGIRHGPGGLHSFHRRPLQAAAAYPTLDAHPLQLARTHREGPRQVRLAFSEFCRGLSHGCGHPGNIRTRDMSPTWNALQHSALCTRNRHASMQQVPPYP